MISSELLRQLAQSTPRIYRYILSASEVQRTRILNDDLSLLFHLQSAPCKTATCLVKGGRKALMLTVPFGKKKVASTRRQLSAEEKQHDEHRATPVTRGSKVFLVDFRGDFAQRSQFLHLFWFLHFSRQTLKILIWVNWKLCWWFGATWIIYHSENTKATLLANFLLTKYFSHGIL